MGSTYIVCAIAGAICILIACDAVINKKETTNNCVLVFCFCLFVIAIMALNDQSDYLGIKLERIQEKIEAQKR